MLRRSMVRCAETSDFYERGFTQFYRDQVIRRLQTKRVTLTPETKTSFTLTN